jgi:hypothetical protein
MELKIDFANLTLTAGPYFLLPEIGDASGQCHLEGFQADAAECSKLENGACGLILLLQY